MTTHEEQLAKVQLNDSGLDLIFRQARTHNVWLSTPVPESTLREIWDVMKFGPTSANCSPLRIVFVQSPRAKERLAACMSENNRAKTRAAPVTAILAMDLEFYEELPRLFPHNQSARSWFAGKPEHIMETALRNSSLQGAYFIIAARALGLDCGPMSGFNADEVNAEFFADARLSVNFVCSIGHGDESKLFARSPRLDFDEACRIA
ncbi:MAG TPA: malonic semialdehyde reductase [Burkholderiaceae bacterium]|jgi:3-hydroxypropanoate dehydrogenase|nr:malonic semialdehyde reductase [Burkholderiaceae bacterium]